MERNNSQDSEFNQKVRKAWECSIRKFILTSDQNTLGQSNDWTVFIIEENVMGRNFERYEVLFITNTS